MSPERTIRLGSNLMVSAPGMLRWAMNGYKFKRDRRKMINVMKTWPGLTDTEWAGVLDGSIPHTIEGETVIIILQGETCGT